MNKDNDLAIADLTKLDLFELKPRYEVNHSGIAYIGITTDSNGNKTEQAPILLASPIHIIGTGIDDDNQYYRVIKYKDTFSKQDKIIAFPMAEIGTMQGWQKLQAFGLTIYAGKRKRDLLNDYLMSDNSNQTKWLITNRAGWCHDNQAYIYPNGCIIAKDKMNVIYNGDKSQISGYCEQGSLQEWQSHVGKYIAVNSRLSLSIGIALAAPLARLCNIEGGGFHLFGSSSIGKSTASKVALSVWGKPSELLLTWSGTGYGFTNTANARNDNLMVLDEIGQATGKAVSDTAYSVINGIGKTQGAKDGGNRALTRWLVLVLSNGEFALENYVKNKGAEWQAGQDIRLPSIPADANKGYGLFDDLLGFSHGSELASHLNEATNHYYGTLGKAWIDWLIDHQSYAKEAVKDYIELFNQSITEQLGSQAKRVQQRFALIAAALILASEQGFIVMSKEQVLAQIEQCFIDWLNHAGVDDKEERQIIQNAIDFMQQYALSDRFTLLTDSNGDRVSHNHAGYRKTKGKTSVEDYFYIVPAIFEKEICRGYDTKKVCQILIDRGMLIKPENRQEKRYTWQIANKVGRYYLLKNSI